MSEPKTNQTKASKPATATKKTEQGVSKASENNAPKIDIFDTLKENKNEPRPTISEMLDKQHEENARVRCRADLIEDYIANFVRGKINTNIAETSASVERLDRIIELLGIAK